MSTFLKTKYYELFGHLKLECVSRNTIEYLELNFSFDNWLECYKMFCVKVVLIYDSKE